MRDHFRVFCVFRSGKQSQMKILIHVCCANCASACVERLLQQDYNVALYFANSNIDSLEEFERRRDDVRRLASRLSLALYEEPYDHDNWLTYIEGFEKEPEGGARCRKCFEYNIGKLALKARTENIECFTTTLTVSPHKKSGVIFEVGSDYKGFIEEDFKKNNGFKRSLELSSENSFYRQNYCGCEFSHR